MGCFRALGRRETDTPMSEGLQNLSVSGSAFSGLELNDRASRGSRASHAPSPRILGAPSVPASSTSSTSSSDLTVTTTPSAAPSVPSGPAIGLPLINLAGISFRKPNPVEDKLHLFDEDSDDETMPTDARLTARLTARTFKKNREEFRQALMSMPMSARQEMRRESPDKVDLTPPQLVVFFHGAVVLFNMITSEVEKSGVGIREKVEY